MSNSDGFWGGDGIFAIIIFLIVAGMFGGFNGFGAGNAASTQITNDFLFNNLSRQVGDNATAINTTDRDVLQNRYDNALQTQTLSSQASTNALQMQSALDSCCCSIKNAIHEDGEATRALITQNRISELEYQLGQANTAVANAVQTQNVLNSLGNYYPRTGVNPYTVYGCTYGTTLS